MHLALCRLLLLLLAFLLLFLQGNSSQAIRRGKARARAMV